jgi:Pyridoxal phosphate biosynthesis protein
MSVIAITIGDYNGIGPEVAIKAAASRSIRADCTPLLIGPYEAFEYYARRYDVRRKTLRVTKLEDAIGRSEITILDIGDDFKEKVRPGKLTPESGKWAGLAIERAIQMCLAGEVDGVVTAPVSKEALRLAGYKYPGQTEMFTVLTKSSQSIMIMTSGFARIALATIHIPISEVPKMLTEDLICSRLEIFNESIRKDFGVKSPQLQYLD